MSTYLRCAIPDCLQRKTMEMMYEMIYEALKEVGLDNKYEPQDYLNFFCLGNREAPDGNTQSVATSNTEKTPQVLLLFFLPSPYYKRNFYSALIKLLNQSFSLLVNSGT